MDLIYVAGFILLSAFFSGSETAFLSINRVTLHSRLEDGDKKAILINKLKQDSEGIIGIFLFCVNACDVAAIILFTNFMISNVVNSALTPLYVTLILTPVLLFFGNLIPKVIFREYADEIMFPLARFYYIFYILFYPIQFVFLRLIKLLLAAIGLKKKKSMFSKDEFNLLLNKTADKGMLKQSEKDFIESIMNFKEIRAKEIMIPLIRMTCVEENDTVEIASALMLTTGHSRIPVFRMRVDNMLGYVENKDLLDAAKHDRVGQYIKESIFVPDLSPINHVLLRMQSKRTQMAFVVDEYGGVSGVITNQDIIAEILGEFVEMNADWIQKEGDSTIVNGLLSIDDLNELLNMKIVKNDFETVAGFVLYRLGKIPEAGDSFEEKKYTFEVASVSNVRVKKVKISPRRKKKEKKQGSHKHAI